MSALWQDIFKPNKDFSRITVGEIVVESPYEFSPPFLQVWFPGDSYDEQLPERVVEICQVSAGSKHSLALACDGRLYSWGHGGNGRLGLAQTATGSARSYPSRSRPDLVEIPSNPATRFKFVATGYSHNAAVDNVGGIFTWGQGSHGRCGQGSIHDIGHPRQVMTLSGVAAMSKVALGMMHSVAMTQEGHLFAWGSGPATGLDTGAGVVYTPRPLPLDGHEQFAYQVIYYIQYMCMYIYIYIYL